jgi:hypothetical protein
MKRALGIAAVVLLLALPAAAQKVSIDYAHDYDFNSIKSFEYVESDGDIAPNPLMHQRIVDAITAKLKAAGLTEDSENPDIYVTYHMSSKDSTVYSTSGFGYGGYGGYWGGWGPYGGGMTSTTTYASTYTEGTLIFDAYDGKEKKLVWRGAGTVTVKDNPEKRGKQLDNILDKLGKKWAKIHAGQGK